VQGLSARRAHSPAFRAFLEEIRAAYSSVPVIALVLDNVITQSSYPVQARLADQLMCTHCTELGTAFTGIRWGGSGGPEGGVGHLFTSDHDWTSPSGGAVLPPAYPGGHAQHGRLLARTLSDEDQLCGSEPTLASAAVCGMQSDLLPLGLLRVWRHQRRPEEAKEENDARTVDADHPRPDRRQGHPC
jgi:hypothetical protein